jgi:hypothetical protein
VYPGLNSHANFASPSNATIYGQIRNDQHSEADKGADGVFFLDRCARLLFAPFALCLCLDRSLVHAVRAFVHAA